MLNSSCIVGDLSCIVLDRACIRKQWTAFSFYRAWPCGFFRFVTFYTKCQDLFYKHRQIVSSINRTFTHTSNYNQIASSKRVTLNGNDQAYPISDQNLRITIDFFSNENLILIPFRYIVYKTFIRHYLDALKVKINEIQSSIFGLSLKFGMYKIESFLEL